MNRNFTLDITRTFAIVLMVVFHFIYDLKFFAYIDWDTPDGVGWREFRWLIISLFFICLGVSLTFAHRQKYRWQKFWIRTSQIGVSAGLISLITYFAIEQNWIFFGVLHFLAVSSVLAIPFIRLPKVSLIIGIVIILIGILQIFPSRWPFHLLFDNLPRYTNDFVAVFPWLGIVFMGIGLGHSKWMQNDPLAFIFKQANNTQVLPAKLSNKWKMRVLLWPGQHSLSIYLLHQPIMMASLYLIARL